MQEMGQIHDLVSFGCSDSTDVSSLEGIDIGFLFKKTNLILKLFKPGRKTFTAKRNLSCTKFN